MRSLVITGLSIMAILSTPVIVHAESTQEQAERINERIEEGVLSGEFTPDALTDILEAETQSLRQEADRSYASVYTAIGMELYEGEYYEEAEEAFRKSLSLDPSNVEVYNVLGIVLTKQERYEEAESIYRSALQVDSENINAHYNLGLILTIQERYEEAEEMRQEVLRIIEADSQ